MKHVIKLQGVNWKKNVKARLCLHSKGKISE